MQLVELQSYSRLPSGVDDAEDRQECIMQSNIKLYHLFQIAHYPAAATEFERH
jgi:hypothetical protein